MASLLDINVLIALSWSNHIHYQAAHRWFQTNRHRGWATCPLTQAGFIRVSMQPAAINMVVQPVEIFRVLKLNLAATDHHFWPLDHQMSGILPEIRQRIQGHHQITDAILLDLAIRRKGRLVTFDRRLAALLPDDSPHQAAIHRIER